MNWTNERIENLEDMSRLVQVANSINASNNILANLTKLIELSDSIVKSGFVTFLYDLALEERTKNAKKTME